MFGWKVLFNSPDYPIGIIGNTLGNGAFIKEKFGSLQDEIIVFADKFPYSPVIDAWLNHINEGGSLGACLIITGLLGLLLDHVRAIAQPLRAMAFALLVSALASFFILVDWQFAKPWIISWHTQKELMSLIRSHASEIKTGDAIILGGITRYARWAPVADGTWDFQNLVRVALNNPTINANVVTERLHIDNDALVDRSGTLILGVYPFKQMILYSPWRSQWLRVSTRQEFIERATQLGWAIAP